MTHPTFDKMFRLWLADRLDDFSKQLKAGEDPEVTFGFRMEGSPPVTCQIRLIDLPGVFTREDFPADKLFALEDYRNEEPA